MDNIIDGTDGKLGHDFMSADGLEEIDIGPRDRPRPTYVSAKQDSEYKLELINLLKAFKECFAWEYYEMPGLDQSIVEHRLPIKPGYHPFKQTPRRFNPNVLDDNKKETERLLEAKFIRPCRYAEWISSVVSVVDTKIWRCDRYTASQIILIE